MSGKKAKGPAHTPKKIHRIYLRERGRCFWCGMELSPSQTGKKCLRPTKDHLLPSSRGGGNSIWNLVLSCRKCNWKKSNDLINPVTGGVISPSVLWVFLKEG